MAVAAAGPEVNKVRALANRAMTIFASDLDRGARLVVKIAVAVRVLAEVAVDAMHSLFEMNVVEVDRLLKLVRIVGRNRLLFGVEQVSLCDRV